MPATVDEAAAIVLAMPGVSEGQSYSNRAWFVGKQHFMWERPFSKADIKRFGTDTPPSGPIIAVRVDDLGEKEAVLAVGHKGVFTIPHFNGYAAVLIQLDVVTKRVLRELLLDAWRSVQ